PSQPSPAPPAGSPHPHRLTAWLQAPASNKEPSPPRHTEGFDDSHFLGSIMEAAAPVQQQQQQQQEEPAVAEAPVKRKRGRPRKNRDGAVAAPAPPKPVKKNDDEEVVCFICFDGGSLVVCDRRGCSKVYHPACIKRDESFFRSRGKWNCGWHICSSCEKAAQYMCYTCTYSLCKACVKQDVKGKHLLTLEELISAKSNWTVRSISARREKEESSGERYEANNDHNVSSDNSSRKRSRGTSLRKRGRKRQSSVA
uniref:PHD-type domain-containing protein n=1 Tax=Aegilops tauschii subsp. strangulata TaxID=200361 RepID=A0A452YLL7_AEGTS